MPRGDRTGPNGMGSKTGRGAGYCNGFSTPGYLNSAAGFGGAYGRGRGCGRGRGMGYGMGASLRGRYAASMPPVAPSAAPFDEKAALKAQAGALEAQLTQINQRLIDLDGETE